MASYLKNFKELLGQFDIASIAQVPSSKNTNTDTLSRLVTYLEDSLLKIVPIEILERPSIWEAEHDDPSQVSSPQVNVVHQLETPSGQS